MGASSLFLLLGKFLQATVNIERTYPRLSPYDRFFCYSKKELYDSYPERILSIQRQNDT